MHSQETMQGRIQYKDPASRLTLITQANHAIAGVPQIHVAMSKSHAIKGKQDTSVT
jgi:hypothetical protein